MFKYILDFLLLHNNLKLMVAGSSKKKEEKTLAGLQSRKGRAIWFWLFNQNTVMM